MGATLLPAMADGGSEEIGNVRLIQAVLEAFNERDVDAIVDAADPKLAFFAPTALIADRKHDLYRGHDGIRLYFDDVARHWDELHIAPENFHSSDDGVIAIGTARGKTRSGTMLESRVAWACRVRDSKIAWLRVYTNPDDAFEDLGLK